MLDRSLVDKRIWPAIDINASGTRREEILMEKDEHHRVSMLRRVLGELSAPDAMEKLTNQMRKSQNQRGIFNGFASRVVMEIKGKIGIVVSSYNSNITDRLLDGATTTLRNAGFDDARLLVRKVPGAWELPLPAKQLALQDDVVGVLTLGAVIRGETTHDQHINRAVSMALMI